MMRHLAKAVATGALIVLLAISASAARAQTPNKPAPPASERTAHLIEAFERQVEANCNALKIPGLSTVVIQDGEVLSARGFGYADVEHRIPATPDTLEASSNISTTVP
jgi:CubicO group peptidase (beta-lactamase class C family)